MTFVLALLLLGQVPRVKGVPSDTLKAATTAAETTAAGETLDVVSYGGKRVIYDADRALVYLLDSAWVSYQDMHLKSDSIVYDIRKHLLSSYQHSFFRSATDTVSGRELHYNLDTRKGYMTLAGTSVDNGFYTGSEMWLVRDKTMDVNDATFTTCDRNPPHYTFWGKQVRVYLDDMVVVEPLVLRIGRVPIIAAPFWFFPISKHRKSGLLPFSVGHSSDEGFYAKNLSWFWAIDDYSDATFALDVLTPPGAKYADLRWSGEGNYAVGPYATGSLVGSYIRESVSGHTRYSITADHSSRFLFGSHLDAKADFQSDATYVADYSETPQLWLKNELDSYANVNRTIKNVGSMNIMARRYVNYGTHSSETDLPSASLSLVTLPLGGGWSVNAGLSASNVETDQDSLIDTTYAPVTHVDRTLGLSPNLSLSLPGSFLGGFTLPLGFSYSQVTRLRRDSTGDSTLGQTRSATTGTGFGFSQTALGFLNISEGANYSEVVGFFPDSTHTNASYGLSASSQFSLYKIFGIEGLGLHGMLHKVTPVITYGYTPATRSRGFYGVPRFDTLPQASNIGLNLANDFQIKVGEARTKRNLGDVNFTTGYNLLTRKLGAVAANADFDILDLDQAKMSTSASTTFDPSTRRLSGYSVSSVFSYEFTLNARDTMSDSVHSHEDAPRHFGINLEHYFDVRGNDTTHMLKAVLTAEPTFKITGGWAFKLTGGWDIRDHKLTDYSIDFTKSLHCWELVGSLDHLGTRWTYDLKVRIKDIPDVALGKSLFGWALPSQFR